MNVWMNEWMDEYVNDWISDFVNEWRNEWVNDQVNEWMGQQAIVQKNERMCEWLTVLMIILWMIDWKILIVWMLYGRICQRDLVCQHSYALWESKSKKRNVLYLKSGKTL